MGGSGGTRTQTTPTVGQQIPDDLRPLIQKSVQGSIDAMDAMPLSGFTGVNVQEIPGLSADEQRWISSIQDWAGSPDLTSGATQGAAYTAQAAGMDPFEQMAGSILRQSVQPTGATASDVDTNTALMRESHRLEKGLTGGAVGSSPATLQAMKAWEDLVRPTVLAGEAMTGNLGGGATEEALAHGKTEALTPLLAKEIDTRQAMAALEGQLGLSAATTTAQLKTQTSLANQQAMLEAAGLDRQAAAQLASIGAGAQMRKLQAGGQLAAIGTEKANLQISAMSKALETAGMPRQIAAQRAQAVYNDFLRRQGMSEALTLGPTSNYLSGALTPGSVTESRQTGGGMLGS